MSLRCLHLLLRAVKAQSFITGRIRSRQRCELILVSPLISLWHHVSPHPALALTNQATTFPDKLVSLLFPGQVFDLNLQSSNLDLPWWGSVVSFSIDCFMLRIQDLGSWKFG